jgi:hypothetical protein
MSRTRRAIPPRLKPDTDYSRWADSPALVEHFKRFDSRLGRDGVVGTGLCGPDMTYPKGFNTYDDYSSGPNSKRFCKRAAAHARRRLGKLIVAEEIEQAWAYNGDNDPNEIDEEVIDVIITSEQDEVYWEQDDYNEKMSACYGHANSLYDLVYEYEQENAINDDWQRLHDEHMEYYYG